MFLCYRAYNRGSLGGGSRLLTGHLTDVERQFVHKRIAEERLELERLESSSQDALVIIAARANGKRGRFIT